MTKTKWSIYTEYVHSRHIAEIVSKYFNNFSMFTGIGHWKKGKERCLVIEIIPENEYYLYGEADVTAICQEINTVNHQKCCFVTSEQVNTMVISERRQPV